MPTTEIQIDEKIKQKIQEPKRWKVLLLNDETTPMDFVVGILTDIFKHTQETAKGITIEVHNTGSGVAGVYSFEIAEDKALEVTAICRENGFPLRIKVEEDI
jgi:ATP-dependent Clp protease adaptor protein ClpS